MSAMFKSHFYRPYDQALMSLPKNPSLYQINTVILLQELSTKLKRKATLDDVPNELFSDLKRRGFDFVWFLGVWQKGEASVAKSREGASKYKSELPDLTTEDVVGSPFAISAYQLSSSFGDRQALKRLHDRVNKNNMRLILDFVPNHVALDHRWVEEHPEFLIQGTEELLKQEPQNYTKIGDKIFAYGRDPYFDGWSDTLQLNYRHKGLREAMYGILKNISKNCDGLRCDMAMLVLPRIFEKTWGDKSIPTDGTDPVDDSFWVWTIQHAGIKDDFVMMAEVYWDMEWELQQQGFDYTYDKRHYDRVLEKNVDGILGHLKATPNFMGHSVRFLENHDEPRIAKELPNHAEHFASAVLTFTVPGLRFFHEGQLQGRKSFVSMHIGRRVDESIDWEIEKFYGMLLSILQEDALRNGQWKLAQTREAWKDNASWRNFVCYTWTSFKVVILVAVNFGPTHAQCYVDLKPSKLLDTAEIELSFGDMASDAKYVRNVGKLYDEGLYLDMRPWEFHIFKIQH